MLNAGTQSLRLRVSLAGLLALIAAAGLVFAYLRPPSEREAIEAAKAYLARSGPAYSPDKVRINSTAKADDGWLIILQAGEVLVRVKVDGSWACRTELMGITHDRIL